MDMNPNKKHVFAISGSTRKNSNNEAIIKAIADLYKELIEVEIFDGIEKLPHFNADIEDENLEPSVIKFRKQIEESDGVIICTPEYVFSIPGSLKNSIEWTVSTIVFSDKPTALITASTSGEKAHEELFLVMKTLSAKINDNTRLLIQGPKNKIDRSGKIIEEKTLNDLKKMMNAFIELMSESIKK